MKFSERFELANELWALWLSAHGDDEQARLKATARPAFMAGAMMAAGKTSEGSSDA